MKYIHLQGRTLALLGVIVPLLILFFYVFLRSGPLAPVAVTVFTVQEQPITPALFGVGTVEARYTYKIGPIVAGRLKKLDVDVGSQVKTGQVLGEMDPVDLDDKIRSQESTFKRAEALLRDASARRDYAYTQMRRYEKLLPSHSISEENIATKRHEFKIAEAALSAAQENLASVRYDQNALIAQRNNLFLIAPVDGLVVLRDVDPGTTIVAGQAVVELIDPKSIWVNVRFDQINAYGLTPGLLAHIVLRSRNDQVFKGRILRVESMADAVTEETMAKVVFDDPPLPLPPIGEMAEITVNLPVLPATTVIPNAAIHRVNGKIGVWRIMKGDLHFTPIKLGVSDLNGSVQVCEGLKNGDQVVIYSEKMLTSHSRIHVVDHITGVSK